MCHLKPLMKKFIIYTILFCISTTCCSQDDRVIADINKPGKYKVVGELGLEMGDTISVKGIIAQGPYKGYEGGPNLRIQIIGDSSIQNLIQIPVIPYFGEFGNNTKVYPHSIPKLENGATYSFLVYETGSYVGRPPDAYEEGGITLQTTGFHFRNQLIVIFGKKIDAIEWSPKDFLGRNALLSGIAKNEGDIPLVQTKKWKLKLIGSNKWLDSEIGKLAEVYGLISEAKDNNTYNVENARARLVRLEDQLGKTVKLRGTARSMNGHWWFNYRGTDMYVENMSELPGWKVENHFLPIEITGVLEQEKLPRIDQIIIKADRDLKMYYIVRKATWVSISELLTPEMDHQQ